MCTHNHAGSIFTFAKGCNTAALHLSAFTYGECLAEAVFFFVCRQENLSFNPGRHTVVCLTCSHDLVDLKRCTLTSQTIDPLCRSTH